MATCMATLLQAMVVVLALVCKSAAGQACGAETTAVPANALGLVDSTGLSTPTPVAYCCPGNSIVRSWTLRSNVVFEWGYYLGSITAKCSDGTALPIIETPAGQGGVTSLLPSRTSTAKRWSAFSARSGFWVDKFLITGGGGGAKVKFSCPAGKSAVGYKASPDFYGINLLQVICG